MGWPEATVIVFVIIGVIAFASTLAAGKAAVWTEEAKGKYGEQYRKIAADYETLAKETRDTTSAIQADLATLREKVDSVEKMMREVG
ncbi:MAG: hypothetical protein ACYDHO_07650 [Gaiellaceae bacterium]